MSNDEDFYVDDEPVEHVLATFERGETRQTVTPADGDRSYGLQLSDFKGVGFERGPWKTRMVDVSKTLRRFQVFHDSVEVIRVEGPPETIMWMFPEESAPGLDEQPL